MRNVEIKNERKVLLKRFRQLSIATATLEAECAAFGPGKYFVTWPASKNVGEGKPRKRFKEVREIYVYDDDEGQETPPAVAAGGRGGVVIYNPRPVARNGFTADDLRALLVDSQKPLLERLEKLEAADDEDDQDDEDEDDQDYEDDEDQAPDILEAVVAIARKPIYSPIVGALLSTATDEQKFAAVDQALAANPGIKQELFADALSLLPKDLLGA